MRIRSPFKQHLAFLSVVVVVCLVLLRPSLGSASTPSSGPIFEYPQNGQTLTYSEAYWFRVQPYPDASGYLWGFFQNGVMVWENLRDEGVLSTNEYVIQPKTTAHRRFTTGDVQVMVRAAVGGIWTDATSITISLKPIQVPVLVMAYFPPDPSNPAYLDPIETGWVNRKITDMQTATSGMIDAGKSLISEATRYHGFKDPNAASYLEYVVSDYREYFIPMPRGYSSVVF